VKTFSRWGDGEWTAILGLKPGDKNVDGHEYFEDMADALRSVLISKPTYALGMQPMSMRNMREPIMSWLEKNGLSFQWENADVFHMAAQKKDWEFMEELIASPHMIVGPQHIRSVFPKSTFITVPSKNCWRDGERIVGEIKRVLDNSGTMNVGFSASMASNVWIHRLFCEYGDRHFFVDYGSVFDPLGGVKSRKYMRC
jgi:hypothetical protein